MIRRPALLLAMIAVAGLGACNEKLEGGAACPSLCPAQDVPIRDTLISPALLFDSTFAGYPTRGTESEMLLATRGDTLEVRGVVRFDSLSYSFSPPSDTARLITRLESTRVRLYLQLAGAKLPNNVRFEVYDVDTAAADTASAATLAMFRKDRLIGSLTLAKAAVIDSVFIPVSDSAVLAKITAHTRLRLGLRVGGDGPVSLRAQTTEGGFAATVSYRPSPDTAVRALTVSPYSSTPTDFEQQRVDLTDYSLVAKYGLALDPADIAVGGVPGRRGYLRFNIPRRITDSTTIIRASLELTQKPLLFGDADTVTVWAHLVVASPRVTDLRVATDLLAPAGLFVGDSLRVVPRDSGLRLIEMNGIVRAWAGQSGLVEPPPRAVVLRMSPEGVLPGELRFYSTRGPVAKRPRLRLSYIPKVTFGVP
jgi:hypothetical protein